MSKLVSLRLPDDVAEWVESYRQGRGWSRAELIGAALRSFREDCEGGVPDLPAEAVEAPPRPKPVPGVVRASSLVPASPLVMARQQKLNEAAARARAGASKGRARP